MSNPFVIASQAVQEEASGVRRDRWGRYLIPDPDTGKSVSWTRVTTFAKAISDTEALQRWGERMAVKGLMERVDLQALAAATPMDDRRTLNKLAEQAKEAAGYKTAANQGTALHSYTERVDKGELGPGDIPEPWRALVRAYVQAMRDHQIRVLPSLIERVIVVKRYRVAGTFDRVVEMPNGELWIADLKTGRDLSYAEQEISIQLALYAHADAIFDYETGKFEPMPEVNQEKALVMHLPVDGSGCTLYKVNIAHGWEAAGLCERVRNWRKFNGLFEQVAKVEADHGNELPTKWAMRIQTATTVEELSRIWREASSVGEWTDALTQLGLQRKEEIE